MIISGFIWLARPTADTNSSQVDTRSITNSLIAQETNFDFGTISMANGTVRHIFRINNTSQEAVTVSKLYTSCMCTTASLVAGSETFGPFGMPGHGAIPSIKATIAPEQEATVEVTFDPNAHGPAGVGTIKRVVTVENSAGAPIQLNFTALVTP